ncbi:MAG TPA: HlyD family secretion protein [Stenotrophomonas sp.]|nr:HlyD family secretion protein [Stenotrophomonas sp.]
MSTPAPPTAASPADAATLARRRRRRYWSLAGFALVALAGAALVLYAWRLWPFTSAIQNTENANVRGQLTIIAPQVSGYVTAVPVQDFQQVQAGQLLVKIDDRIYQQQLQQAQAQLQSAQANLANWEQSRRGAAAVVAENRAGLSSAAAQRDRARAALQRAERLADEQLLSTQDRDTAFASNAQARAAVEQAQAALEAAEQNVRSVEVNRAALAASVANAEAALQLARINLDNTRIVAPRAGQLGQIGVRVGAYVTNGTQLMALVPDTLWIIANFKETQMANVRIGQQATFTVDALNNARLRGRVLEISPAAGSEFAILPADNATGNFVKIAQRIPVKIGIDPDQPLAAQLRPGMSVVVALDTASPGSAPPAQR